MPGGDLLELTFLLSLLLGAFVGALTGWRVWDGKGRTPWHGAVVGGLLGGSLSLLGLLILLVIWTVWHPSPAADPD
jgi:hypothetical protein